jgi:cytochrome P450
LPVIVIAEMLGIEREKRATFKAWSQDIVAGFFNPLKLAEQTARGQSISVSLAAANRDPRAHSKPDVFDIRRKDIRHQSFGGGKHLCLWVSRG